MRQTSTQNDPSPSKAIGTETEDPSFMNKSFLDQPKDQDCLDPMKKFMDQVNQRPEAIAAVFEDEHVTYQELNRRANQFGHWLQHKGIGPETIVGVCMDRSISLVLSILGIIKAGGCLLLLEPSYPRNRLVYMVENSQPLLVLTQERYVEVFQHCDVTLVGVNNIENDLSGESCQNLATRLWAGNLRVIFYTSGSTGHPKGVMEIYRKDCPQSDSDQEQDSVESQSLKLASTDRMLVKCPMSFAPFLWELIQPLFAGGTVILAQSGGEQDFSYLLNLMINESVTISHFVPSSLRIFLEQPDIKSCTCLTSVCCSGEILSDTIRERFFATLNADIFLTYAATEAPGATWVHLHRNNFRQPLKLDQQKSAKIFALDSTGNPVSGQGQGELYVEASERIRGYFHQPGLTAEKFVPDPFRSTPGTRLYRTGDLAKVLLDGNFQVVGRKDQQVKIRGFRIELGEIEAALNQNPDIQEALVICREITPGDNQLVAYFIQVPQSSLNHLSLRRMLKNELPEYMIPTNFVKLESWPLTSNGKVNHRALPTPAVSRPDLETTYVPPRTPYEEQVAAIWRDLLSIEQIGIHDNFFELGGDSLLATQLMMRLRKQLHINLSLRTFFEQSTVAALASATQKIQNTTNEEAGEDSSLADLLNDLDALSEEEAQAILEQESRQKEITALPTYHQDEEEA